MFSTFSFRVVNRRLTGLPAFMEVRRITGTKLICPLYFAHCASLRYVINTAFNAITCRQHIHIVSIVRDCTNTLG